LLGSVFVAVNLLLSAYFLDAVPSPNPTSRALPVLTIYEEGRYAIDTYEKSTMDKSFVNGHYYPDKAPLTTWIVLPFYGVLKWLHVAEPASGRPRWLPATLLGDFLCGSVPFVLLVWLILRKVVRDVPAADAVLLCMLPLYGRSPVRRRVHEPRACWCLALRVLHSADQRTASGTLRASARTGCLAEFRPRLPCPSGRGRRVAIAAI
jgi:hypothetical protein